MIEALALVGVISLLIVARKSLRWYRMNRALTPWFWWEATMTERSSPDIVSDLQSLALTHEAQGRPFTSAMLRQASFEIDRLRATQPARSSAGTETPLLDLIAAKANEPEFREFKERLDANINWPRYLPILKVRPTGVTSWIVILPSGAEHIISDEDWKAALTVNVAQPLCGRAGGNCECTSIDECARAFAQANQE